MDFNPLQRSISLCMGMLCIVFCIAYKSEINSERMKTMNTNSYVQEEVKFSNKVASVTLAGTLSLPQTEGPFPAAILIAGYGPNDRNVTGMGHEYFKVLAEYLTQRGIVVLRYDKRGVGGSTGDWACVTSKELADDVIAGVEYLKTRQEIDQNAVGVVGLSEGGLIAAIAASQCNQISFAVLMAPHVALGVDDLVYQAELQLRADGATVEFIEHDKVMRTAVYTVIKEQDDQFVAQKMVRELIEQYLNSLSVSQVQDAEKLPFAFTLKNMDMLIEKLTAPGYRFFMRYDPAKVLKALTIPVLVLASKRDSVVSCDKTFPIVQRAFEESGHTDYTMLLLPNLNHLFQTCETGALAEYATIKETMAPIALKTIGDWIIKQSNKA